MLKAQPSRWAFSFRPIDACSGIGPKLRAWHTTLQSHFFDYGVIELKKDRYLAHFSTCIL
jgi:hypothetical protein